MGWAAERRLGRALAVAAVFVGSGIGLAVLHAETAPRYGLSGTRAIAAARADPLVARFLAGHPGATRAETIPLDRTLRRVTFFDGPRVLLDAAVDPHGRVRFRQEHLAGRSEMGSPVANSPWMLIGLTALFVLATAVVPLRRMRNLDVLALASLTIPVLLLNQQLVAASVAVSAPALAYLAARCLRRAAGPGGAQAGQPLFDRLTAGWDAARRRRLLGLITGATAVAFLMITLTSTGESDVAAASLSGATRLLHGELPYGRASDYIVHGDTYPLLTYVAYIPGAAWRPVTDAFSDLSGSLPIAALGALIVAVALHRTARRQLALPRDAMRLVLAWLAFPAVVLAASAGSNDLVLAACLAAALVLLARPGASMLVLTAAAWVKVVPVVLLPVWWARHRRLRAAAGALVLSAALVAWLVALGGLDAVGAMLDALSFQFQRASFHAPWRTFGLQWLQPWVQAAVPAALTWMLLAWRSDRRLAEDQVRVAGAAGALLLMVQLSANYWTWMYLPWAFPFLALALLFDAGGQPPATSRRRNTRYAAPRQGTA